MTRARLRIWLGAWIWLIAAAVPAMVGGDDGMRSVSFRDIADDVKVKSIRFQHVTDKPFLNRKLRAAMKTVEGKPFGGLVTEIAVRQRDRSPETSEPPASIGQMAR